MENSSKYI